MSAPEPLLCERCNMQSAMLYPIEPGVTVGGEYTHVCGECYEKLEEAEQ